MQTPFLPLALALVLALAAAGRPRRLMSGRGVVALAALPLAQLALLVSFVLGEDDYRGGGITRWDAYRKVDGSGATDDLFFGSVALLAGAAGLLVFAGWTRRRALVRRTAAGAAIVSLLLLTVTYAAFSLN